MIQLRGITKSFGSLQVLRGIDLDIARGEIVSIVGPSGAGKTTLLQIMGTLDRPDSGQTLIDGQDVSRLGEKPLPACSMCLPLGHAASLEQQTGRPSPALCLAVAGDVLDEVDCVGEHVLDAQQPAHGLIGIHMLGPAFGAGQFDIVKPGVCDTGNGLFNGKPVIGVGVDGNDPFHGSNLIH